MLLKLNFSRSIDPTHPHVSLEAVKLKAAVCLVPPDGHDKTLEAITIAGEVKGVDRFHPIVQGRLEGFCLWILV